MPKFDPDITTFASYKPLVEWLRLHNAQHVWSAYSDNGPTVVGYGIAGAIVHVTLHRPTKSGMSAGWDLSMCPNTNNIVDTFDEIERQLGLEVAR